MSRPPVIAVIGENDPPPDVAALAEAVGAEIASAGAVLVCGGLGGVMEAACRGARGKGGITIGGRYGTLSEIAFATIEGIPVIGLRTWELKREELTEDSIRRAADATEAVVLALQAARTRG